MKIELLQAIAGETEHNGWLTEKAQMALELIDLHAAIQKPAEQCGNCDDYYAASVMQTTEDGVTLCPGCWKECSEASAILTLPAEE